MMKVMTFLMVILFKIGKWTFQYDYFQTSESISTQGYSSEESGSENDHANYFNVCSNLIKYYIFL